MVIMTNNNAMVAYRFNLSSMSYVEMSPTGATISSGFIASSGDRAGLLSRMLVHPVTGQPHLASVYMNDAVSVFVRQWRWSGSTWTLELSSNGVGDLPHHSGGPIGFAVDQNSQFFWAYLGIDRTFIQISSR